MDRVSFCNVYVIQQDTQYLMINFFHNIQWLNMFRASVVHLQESSYAVCCNLVCLDTFCCYEGEGRTAGQFFLHPIKRYCVYRHNFFIHPIEILLSSKSRIQLRKFFELSFVFVFFSC